VEEEAIRELKASVFKLGEDFHCFKVGEIIWDGEQIRVEPAGVRELQEIASRPYWTKYVKIEAKELRK